MYVCGPTVYDRAHIGNARPVVVFDILYRLLKYLYGEKSVTYARNITDVDDKIIAKSSAENKPVNEITSETIKWFIEDNNNENNFEINVYNRYKIIYYLFKLENEKIVNSDQFKVNKEVINQQEIYIKLFL